MSSQNQRNTPGKSGDASRRKSLGRAGESVAKKHLASEGYRVLAENFRRKGGEADLVLLKDNILVFCEVKTRIHCQESDGIIESYSLTQQRRLVAVSETYLSENAHELPRDFELRYDVLIVGNNTGDGLKVLEHIPDAFRPG